MRRRPPRVCSLRHTIALAIALCAAGPVAAQVVERNLPPPAATSAVKLPSLSAPGAEASNASLGAPLVCLRLEAGDGAGEPCTGIVVDPSLPPLDRRAQRALTRLLGRPLSLRAIGEARAAVVSSLRRRHRPFVSVTTPPQEITDGVLRLRVLQYRLGALTIRGAPPAEAGRIRSQVRAQADRPIDAQALGEDLSWLNRVPSRAVSVVLSPGHAPGDVDIDLRATPLRPWRIYGGAASSDSPESGDARLFAGGQLALPRLLDGAWAGYQFTTSATQGDARARYASHAARLDALAAPGLLVELAGDYVDSRRIAGDFATDQRVAEASVSLRTPFSRLFGLHLPWLSAATVVSGVEVRHADRQVRFGGVSFERAAVDVYQLRTGLEGAWEHAGAVGGGDLVLHVSPGGLGAANGDEAFSAYAFGRPVSASYAYATLSTFVRLPPVHGFSYLGELQGQVSTGELPETEKAGVGGAALVRGAVLDDGAFSRQLVLRNTLTGPAWWLGRFNVAPDVFADVGYGAADAATPGRVLASLGVGGEVSLRSNLSLTANVACVLSRGAATRPGDCRGLARLIAAF